MVKRFERIYIYRGTFRNLNRIRFANILIILMFTRKSIIHYLYIFFFLNL